MFMPHQTRATKQVALHVNTADNRPLRGLSVDSPWTTPATLPPPSSGHLTPGDKSLFLRSPTAGGARLPAPPSRPALRTLVHTHTGPASGLPDVSPKNRKPPPTQTLVHECSQRPNVGTTECAGTTDMQRVGRGAAALEDAALGEGCRPHEAT